MALIERENEHVQVNRGAYVSIEMAGKLDRSYQGYEEIVDVVAEAMEEEHNVVIDMTGVTYIGFHAFRKLAVAARTALDNETEIQLVIDNGQIYRQFLLTGHNNFFSIHRTKESALSNLGIKELTQEV